MEQKIANQDNNLAYNEAVVWESYCRNYPDRGGESPEIESLGLSTLSDLYEKDFPPPKWLVNDIIPEEAVVLLSASPASYKTWFALELSRSIASGEEFLGKFKTSQTGVLIIDAESGEKQLYNHFKVLGARRDLPIFYKTYINKKLDADFASSIALECLDNNIKFVVFDSLTRFHDANENDAREMSKVFTNFSFLKSLGLSVLVIHHNRKRSINAFYDRGRNGASESARGSSDIPASCDLQLSMERGDGVNKNIAVLQQLKSRFNIELNSFKIKFVKVSDNCSQWEFLEFLKSSEEIEERRREQVLNLVGQRPGLNQKQLFEETRPFNLGLGEKKFYELLKSLRDSGDVLTTKGEKTSILYHLNNQEGESQNV